MRKKFQIFISSTFSDLQKERQACVEAVLKSGHIPAGMELFSAGNETQLEIIKRWIEDSDIYILILGGRYGSIDAKSGLSYTEVEYRYALELNKPFFALVMHEDYLNEKVKIDGKDILEFDNVAKYKDFKGFVLSKISKFFNNDSEIKLAILESLIDIQSRFELTGWIKANEIPDLKQTLSQITELTEKNKILEQELRIIETGRINKIGDYTYEEIKTALSEIIIDVPVGIGDIEKEEKIDLLSLFILNKQLLSGGVTNRVSSSEDERFMYNNIMPHLRIFDLAEIVKIAGVSWTKFQTSKLGNKFLATYSMREKK